jgi:DNA ligase N terminus
MTPLPLKTQSSLDSFFGSKPVVGAATKKAGPKQKKIESFFTSSSAASASSKASPVVTGSEPRKENAKLPPAKKDATDSDPPLPKASSPEAADSMDSAPMQMTTSDKRNEEDEIDADGPVRKTKRVGPSSQTSKRRRVIHDDDDSDDDEADKEDATDGDQEIVGNEPTSVHASRKDDDSTKGKPDSHNNDTMAEDDKVPAASGDKGARKGDTTQTKPPLASVPQTSRGATVASTTSTSVLHSKLSNTRSKDKVASEDEELDDAISDAQEDAAETAAPKSSVAKSTAKKAKTTKSDLTKGPYKTDEAVLKEISSSVWTTGADMPYVVLCQAFVKIEAISGRLDIQEILTTLFRQIMLQQCFSDMSPVVYLASNSVAAAYECVELGIGDALLIKAIGEATGATPAKIKPKYEAVGDLGTVAQSLKSKQSTLGGYFAATKKTTKDYLTAKQVLETFRKIAGTKGNQSQTLKVNLIKKLLVQTTDPCETKYIVRGLQGKLRIGLARSTVLVSLAHALALTVPKTIATDSPANPVCMSERHALLVSLAAICPCYSNHFVPALSVQ